MDTRRTCRVLSFGFECGLVLLIEHLKTPVTTLFGLVVVIICDYYEAST